MALALVINSNERTHLCPVVKIIPAAATSPADAPTMMAHSIAPVAAGACPAIPAPPSVRNVTPTGNDNGKKIQTGKIPIANTTPKTYAPNHPANPTPAAATAMPAISNSVYGAEEIIIMIGL